MSAVSRATTQSFTDHGDRGYVSLQAEAPVGLKEFLRNNGLPCFAKISRACPNRSGSNRDEEVYLYCAAKVSYVVADEMSVVHRKHIQPTSQRFYVPLDCRGWFEVLSQDGISARPFGSVAELAKLGVSSRCLVRQSIGGYIRKTDGYDTQIIRKGDVLIISETLWVSSRSSAAGTLNKQLLRCTDQRGQEVFLDLNQNGLFSPIAGNTNVTGAHTVKSLLTKFRLPVMVRLLYGNISQTSGSTYSTGVFKLMNVFADEIVFALPIKSRPEDRILPVPTRAKSLKLRRTQKSRDELIPTLSKHCKLMVNRHLDTILSTAAIYESSWLLADIELEPLKMEEKKRASGSSSSRSNSCPADPEEEELFREIEDIYNSIANPIVPRPIVFTTGSAARSKGLRRNITAVPKAKTVQHRPSTSAQKTRVLDDNWQMLPRELGSPVIHLQTSSVINERTHAVQSQTVAKHEKTKRKLANNETSAIDATDDGLKRGEHLYEEIPLFSRANLDETGMDVQKTMYISDNSISFPDSSHDSFDRDAMFPKSEKVKLSDDLRSPSVTAVRSDTPKDKKVDGKQEPPARRKRLHRPKSLVGPPFTNELELTEWEISIDGAPPPLPPKRGESMCNLRDDLNASISPTATSPEFCHTPSPIPEISMALDAPTTDDISAAAGPPATAKGTSVDRRPSSKVSSAVKTTMGNVSRSFLNTIRRIGGRSSATLVINNLEEAKQPDAVVQGGSSKESVDRSSPESSPEPQQTSGDKPNVVPESGFSNRSEDDPTAAVLQP